MAESERAAARPAGPDPARSLLGFVCLIVAAGVADAHVVFGDLLPVYLDPGFGVPLWLAETTGALAAGLGVVWFRRARTQNRERLSLLAIGSAITTNATAVALFFAFPEPHAFDVVVFAGALSSGLLLGGLAAALWGALGRTVFALGVLRRLLDPFVLLALVVTAIALAAAGMEIGAIPTAGVAGLGLCLAGGWWPKLAFFVERRPLARPRATLGAAVAGFCACGALIGAWQRVFPLRQARRFVNPVVYARHDPTRSYVVTSGQRNFELYVDGSLKVSELDARRYFESLVHPAFAASRRHARVLLIGGGDGLAEREILRHSDVESVTDVMLDKTLPELATSLRWLRVISHDALDSPRVHIVGQDPIVWLANSRAEFDIAIVNLLDPDNYYLGKDYTRYFYKSLAARLAPDGVAAVQATSPFGTPRTFSNILTTVRAAGLFALPYHAGVPTFGDWGFVLAAHHALSPPTGALPPGLAFLTQRTLTDLFRMPPDDARPSGNEPSTLYDQRAVRLFARERRRFRF